MAYLRFVIVLGVMLLPTSIAHAATADDAYIAGYAARVLKHGLKLDMRSLAVRDGVITLPAGGLDAGDRAKAVQLLSEIPGVNKVEISEATHRQLISDSLKPVRASATESTILSKGLLPTGHLFRPALGSFFSRLPQLPKQQF